MSGFFQAVYRIVGAIPPGRVMTYGQIARELGRPTAGRLVGWAMRAAPVELGLPCHRVVNRFGGLAPEYCFEGPGQQRAMLEAEGIVFDDREQIDLERFLWRED